MKVVLLIFLLVIGLNDFNRISEVNHYKNEAEEAVQAKDYERAISAYKVLIDSLGVMEEPVLLNIANAYYNISDTTNAAYYYSRLVDGKDTGIRSQAYHQLGVIDQQQNKLEAALDHFKNALKSNPGNEAARYNYELLKKLMQDQQQQEQNQDQKNEDQNQEKQEQEQQKKEQQDQQQQEQEQQQKQEQQQQEEQQQEKGEQEQQQQESDQQKQQQGEEQQQQETPEEGEENQMPPSRKEKLEELNLTEEKARMILEAMKNNEMQYLQQMQRKATKKPDSDKPDW